MENFATTPSKHRCARFLLAFALALFVGADSVRSARCTPPPRAVFSGITYGCELLKPGAEGYGVLHWVRVELSAPGIELYVSPLDPSALEAGFQYRLRWIDDVLRSEGLAVAINGALFTSKPGWRPRLPGDLAKGVETVVSDHVASHIWEHTYLLWFDDALNPHLRPSKPPNPEELRKAKWGVGGQGVGLRDGKIWSGSDRTPDSRTAVGIDAEHKLLFLTVAEWASPRLLLEQLSKLGARDAMLLDGGSSSAMAIGEGGVNLATGTLLGGWRPVATFFGVRARRLSP
jgi:phosphodiester glycosidase